MAEINLSNTMFIYALIILTISCQLVQTQQQQHIGARVDTNINGIPIEDSSLLLTTSQPTASNPTLVHHYQHTSVNSNRPMPLMPPLAQQQPLVAVPSHQIPTGSQIPTQHQSISVQPLQQLPQHQQQQYYEALEKTNHIQQLARERNYTVDIPSLPFSGSSGPTIPVSIPVPIESLRFHRIRDPPQVNRTIDNNHIPDHIENRSGDEINHENDRYRENQNDRDNQDRDGTYVMVDRENVKAADNNDIDLDQFADDVWEIAKHEMHSNKQVGQAVKIFKLGKKKFKSLKSNLIRKKAKVFKNKLRLMVDIDKDTNIDDDDDDNSTQKQEKRSNTYNASTK